MQLHVDLLENELKLLDLIQKILKSEGKRDGRTRSSAVRYCIEKVYEEFEKEDK